MSEFADVKTADLEGAALDWAVAQVEGISVTLAGPAYGNGWRVRKIAYPSGKYSPSADWGQGGPLIDKHDVDIDGEGSYCEAWIWMDSSAKFLKAWGDTRLIASCRVIVESALGDTVQVPKELCP
jgi:hypothetical protein